MLFLLRRAPTLYLVSAFSIFTLRESSPVSTNAIFWKLNYFFSTSCPRPGQSAGTQVPNGVVGNGDERQSTRDSSSLKIEHLCPFLTALFTLRVILSSAGKGRYLVDSPSVCYKHFGYNDQCTAARASGTLSVMNHRMTPAKQYPLPHYSVKFQFQF